MKRYWKLPVAALLLALFQAVNTFIQLGGLKAEIAVGEMGLNYLFQYAFVLGRYSPDLQTLSFLMIDLLFLMVFCVLTCRILSEDYCLTGVYTFTRQMKKSRWYFRRVGNLLGMAFVYILVYLGAGVLFLMSMTGAQVNDQEVFRYLFFENLAAFTLFAFALSLIINLLSIQFGTASGIIFSWLAIVLSTVILYSIFLMLKEPLLRANPELQDYGYLETALPFVLMLLVYLNPMAHILLCFHTAPQDFLNFNLEMRMTVSGNIQFTNMPDYLFSLAYLAVAGAAATLIGWLYLRKKDISLVNQETL